VKRTVINELLRRHKLRTKLLRVCLY